MHGLFCISRTPDAANMLLSAIAPNAIRIGRKPLRDIQMSKIFYLGFGRNAWNCTWINRYRSDSLSFDPANLRRAAEPLRIPGSVFSIASLPLLVLRTNRETFGICEINQRSPYEYDRLLERISYDGPRSLGSCLPPLGTDWLLILKLSWRTMPKTELSSYYARSFARGSHYSLGWSQFDRDSSSDAMFLSFADRLTTLLKNHGRSGDFLSDSRIGNETEFQADLRRVTM